jgi:hypothetical protein
LIATRTPPAAGTPTCASSSAGVRAHDGDAIAPLEAAGAQRRGEVVDAGVELAVGAPQVAVHDGRAIGMERRAAPEEDERVEPGPADRGARRPGVALGEAAAAASGLRRDGRPGSGAVREVPPRARQA